MMMANLLVWPLVRSKKVYTCLLCLVVGFLSFPTGGPIFKPEIEQRVNYACAFCAWRRLDRGAEIH